MSLLTSTPSSGHSEVLDTLHYYCAHTHGLQLQRLAPLLSGKWGGTDLKSGSDPDFESDVKTIVGALQTAGYIVGRDDATGATVDLTGTPGPTTRVVLTGAGRVESRHPRPRPTRIYD